MPSPVSADPDGEEYLARVGNDGEGPAAEDDAGGSDVEDYFDDEDSCFTTASIDEVEGEGICNTSRVCLAQELHTMAPTMPSKMTAINRDQVLQKGPRHRMRK